MRQQSPAHVLCDAMRLVMVLLQSVMARLSAGKGRTTEKANASFFSLLLHFRDTIDMYGGKG